MTTSTWAQSAKKPKYQPLKENIVADVVVIGGGLTGIQCAYYAAKAGKRAVVLEKNTLGSGTSGPTTVFEL